VLLRRREAEEERNSDNQDPTWFGGRTGGMEAVSFVVRRTAVVPSIHGREGLLQNGEACLLWRGLQRRAPATLWAGSPPSLFLTPRISILERQERS
jgi:hypothetical protein